MPRIKLEVGSSGIHVELNPIIGDFFDAAQSFSQAFQIKQALRFTPTQLHLFRLYFAGYYAQKVVADTAYIYRLPVLEQAREYPIVGRLVRTGTNFVEQCEKIGRGFMAVARDTEEFMKADTNMTLRQYLSIKYEGLKDTFESIIVRETSSAVVYEYNAFFHISIDGRPDGIKNAANILSTHCIKLEDAPRSEKEDVRSLIERVIERFANSSPWFLPVNQPGDRNVN